MRLWPLTFCAAATFAAALAACHAMPADPAQTATETPQSRAARDPFAPATLRIHPLTHVDTGERSQQAKTQGCEVVLHFELLDRYGDSVKGLGSLSVELYKPGPGMTPGIETQELTWDIPGMDDPDQNSRRFDSATRTYRIPLSAPRWVFDAVSPARGPGWVKVRAVLTIPVEGGEPRYLEDEYVIQG
jgi:hypothetical protein